MKEKKELKPLTKNKANFRHLMMITYLITGGISFGAEIDLPNNTYILKSTRSLVRVNLAGVEELKALKVDLKFDDTKEGLVFKNTDKSAPKYIFVNNGEGEGLFYDLSKDVFMKDTEADGMYSIIEKGDYSNIQGLQSLGDGVFGGRLESGHWGKRIPLVYEKSTLNPRDVVESGSNTVSLTSGTSEHLLTNGVSTRITTSNPGGVINDVTPGANVARVRRTRAAVDDSLITTYRVDVDIPNIGFYSGGKKEGTYTRGSSLGDVTPGKLKFDFGNGLLSSIEDTGSGEKTVFVRLDKEALKKDPAFKGDKGDKGDAGVAGTNGTNGKDGATGAKGDKGDKGDAGVAGINGTNGKDGATGAKGDKGDKGDTGVAGTNGTNGKDGVNGKDGTADLTGDITPIEEKGVKGKVIHKHLREKYVDKKELEIRDARIINNHREIQENKEAIAENTKRIEQVDKKINKTAALAQATANLDFGQVKVGNMAIGAGVGNYMNETGVSVGVAYRPTEDIFLTAKWSGLAGEPRYNSYGASASYQFNFK